MFVMKQSLLQTQEWNSNKLKLLCPKTEADGKWLHFCEDTGTGKTFIDTFCQVREKHGTNPLSVTREDESPLYRGMCSTGQSAGQKMLHVPDESVDCH